MREMVLFNTHAEIGYSGNVILVVDYNTGAFRRKDICRMRFLIRNTGEEITRFYLDRNSIWNLKDILKEVK